jgi:putative ABC transport system substrate-binding protein
MGRRQFILRLGVAAAVWPIAAHAEQSPKVRRIGAIFAGNASDPRAKDNVTAFTDALQTLGRDAGIAVMPDSFPGSHRDLIVSLVTQHGVPTIYPWRYMTAAGGQLSYGVDPVDAFRKAPVYIDRILKGEKAADLPVQQPTKFELVINTKAAKALGLTIPPTLLARADEVIE